MFASIFKPRPYPALVLLAIIFAFFGFNVPRPIGVIFFAIAAILLFTFIRGLVIDLSIGKEGVTTFGRVTKVEHQTAMRKKERDEWWDVHFTFTDMSGVAHEMTTDLWDKDEASRYAEGSSVKIRYHPKYPEDVWRWLE